MTELPSSLQGLQYLNYDSSISRLYNCHEYMPLGSRRSNYFLTGKPEWYDGSDRELKIIDKIIEADIKKAEAKRGPLHPADERVVFMIGVNDVLHSPESKSMKWTCKAGNWWGPGLITEDFYQFCKYLERMFSLQPGLVENLLSREPSAPSTPATQADPPAEAAL